MTILASCLFMAVLIYVFVNKFQRWIRGEHANDGSDGQTTLSLKECFWFVYGAMLRQGATVDPASGIRRINLT